MKRIIAIIILIVLLLIGGVIVGYPFISNYLMSLNLDSEVQTYLNSSAQMDKNQFDEEYEKAKKYNESLIGNVIIGDPFAQQTDSDTSDNYYDLLNVSDTSVMAVIDIPAIDIRYPVYHGTGNSVLDKGIGHLKNTSLPIGGKGTHSVLTGHTGYSSAKLFTDLDKLQNGDVFFITVLNETLAYKVDQIKVVDPSDTSDLKIDPDKDYITLVTCTPFGVNSHRLLVRGTRTSLAEAQKQSTDSSRIAESTWNDEYTYAIIIGGSVMAGILIVYFLISFIIKHRRKRKTNE